MNMLRPSHVVSGIDGLELNRAILVCKLYATKSSVLKVLVVAVIAIEHGLYTTIDTLQPVRNACNPRPVLTVELACQISTAAFGIGWHVAISTTWISKKSGIPGSPSVMFWRTCSP